MSIWAVWSPASSLPPQRTPDSTLPILMSSTSAMPSVLGLDSIDLFNSPVARDDLLDDVTSKNKEFVALCSPPVCSNVPNSSIPPQTPISFQHSPDIGPFVNHFDSVPTTSLLTTDNSLVVFAEQPANDPTYDTITTLERYFSVSGNIYQFGHDWVIRLYEQHGSSPFTQTPSTPIVLGQNISIGMINFHVDDAGRLYSIVDRSDPLEPKSVFNTAAEVLVDLCLAQVLPSPPLSASEIEAGAQGNYKGSGSPLGSDWGTVPFDSPTCTDSGVSESSVESNGSCDSLFSGAGLDAWVTVVQPTTTHPNAALDPTSIPTPPPSPTVLDETNPVPYEKTATKADIDRYADHIKRLRLKLKGSKSTQIEVKCPWCGWASKRPSHPSELKEHMYAHRGLSEFYCPSNGCPHVSNRRSNLTRHVNKHHPAMAAEFKAKRPTRF
ncbi:hypothetical protein RhiJN_05363 [Ceratobasidium sp. AG-Ba]|nr:hypothetical protein RhiJN_05363 [Ceratobasidium sp. AG-Ba]